MLTFFLDLLPVFLFFLTFKYYGIYAATIVGIEVTGIQLLLTRLFQSKYDRKQLIIFIIFVIFGGLTLYFHNPIFVKWKPTLIFWIFGIALLLSHFIGSKPLIRHMMESAFSGKTSVPNFVWSKLSWAWILFFLFLGTLNLYVAYSFSTNVWVNFKLYGIFSLLFIFSFLQALYLSKYLNDASND